MIPSSFIQLAALPLNWNGKLDHDALPEPVAENMMRDAGYRGPSTPTEEQLGRTLAGLLEVDHIGVDDNFFLLGMHSLLATQVAARVFELFGVQLQPRHLYEAKTIARLAAEVDRQLIEQLEALSDEEVKSLLA
jgi:acyl carrier protein